MQQLPTRQELEQIIVDVVDELGLTAGKPYYANAEYEELLRGEVARPTEDIAVNLRLELVDGKGGLRLIRLRLEPENNKDEMSRRRWITHALRERLQFLINKTHKDIR